MRRTYDVIVTRNTTESCTMLVEAENRAAAIMLAHERSYRDPDLVWEQDDTPNASKEHYVTSCEAQEDLGS
ncbi:MAG: hypothetical protein M9945_14440 [Aquamicrobium sp.]|uniref:hypothetical protein n=1 Tax=Aquamicrobium sp. TaxID=1872579 RepID=UPI00349E9559|nr:hypothetical protein [Aquamicrobium sp.]